MTDLRQTLKAMLTPAQIEELRQPLFAGRFVEEILDLAKQNAPTHRARERGISRALRFLRAVEKAYGLSLDLPITYRPALPASPTRRVEWADQAKAVFRLADQLENRLKQRGICGEAGAALIILSAILNSALLRPEGWLALWTALAQGNLEIKRSDVLGDVVWIDLDISKTEALRVYPDVVTLSLLARWRPCALPSCRTVPHMLGQISATLDLGAPLNVETLTSAGFAPLEDRLGAEVPQVLFCVASGVTHAAPVPSDKWEACLRGEGIERRSGGKARSPVLNAQVHQSATQSEKALAQALRVKRKGAQKVTRGPVQRALTDLLGAGPTPIVRARILWFLTLLKRRLKVSSLRRYNSAIADVMTLAFEEHDPARMAVAEIETRLNAVLEGPLSRRDAMIGARLHQFFDFTATDPRLYWPEPVLDLPHTQKVLRPRTAVISGAQISRALAQTKSHQPLMAAILMGARGGLRVSDMEALLIRDVEQGPNGVLRIHPTKEGDIKTAAGRRQVPLPLLLTGSELGIWQAVTAARRQGAPKHDAQFLGQGGSLLEATRFDRSDFAGVLSGSLGLSPHDLRHGALSNIALALLAPKGAKTVGRFTGWSAARIEAIRTELTGRDTLGGMHQIARLAGHREATTTFKTYLHLNDLALGLHIAAAKDMRPIADAARQLGLNTRSIKAKKVVALESLRPRILAKLALTDIKPVGRKFEPVQIEVPDLSPDLILRLCAALRLGISPFELSKNYGSPVRLCHALAKYPPLPAAPRRKLDRLWVAEQIGQLLNTEEPAAHIHLIRSMPKHALCFSAPKPAHRWINGFGRDIRSQLHLHLAKTDGAARWAGFNATTTPARYTRLVIQAETPAGTNAVPLLHYTAEVALRILAARSANG
jgi:integrase